MSSPIDPLRDPAKACADLLHAVQHLSEGITCALTKLPPETVCAQLRAKADMVERIVRQTQVWDDAEYMRVYALSSHTPMQGTH